MATGESHHDESDHVGKGKIRLISWLVVSSAPSLYVCCLLLLYAQLNALGTKTAAEAVMTADGDRGYG